MIFATTNGGAMTALHRLAYRLRAWRIDRLRARTRTLERRQRRALTRLTERTMSGRPMATMRRAP